MGLTNGLDDMHSNLSQGDLNSELTINGY
jgi:hypothetical protein